MNVLELTDLAIREESIANGRCFTCGGLSGGGVGEHVVPKWLQKQCDLFDERLTLSNGTFIPYRHLTIPCCLPCNTGFLSRIEGLVRSVFDRGTLESKDEELAVARWLSKILLGILVKETRLRLDRSDPVSESIIPPDFIDQLRQCHLILQSARKITTFRCLHSDFPFSFYHYRVPNFPTDRSFDLSTNIFGQSVAIRVGSLAAVFVNDGGLQMEVGPKGPFELCGSDLSVMQFREIVARVHYKATLRDATHFYLTTETERTVQIEQTDVHSFSGYFPDGETLRIFREWDEAELSFGMASYMRVDRATIFDGDANRCRTTFGSPTQTV